MPNLPPVGPLLTGSDRGHVASLERDPNNASRLTLTYTWPRQPTAEDKRRCWVVLAANTKQLSVAAGELQCMAGQALLATGPASVQVTGGPQVRLAQHLDWTSADAPHSYRAALTLHPTQGPQGRRPALQGRAPLTAAIFDYGKVPPEQVSDALTKTLTF